GPQAELALVQGRRSRSGEPSLRVGQESLCGGAQLVLGPPKLTLLAATAIFGSTLLLVPFIGGEFLPHLDEGALWVRATMPYTISFEEAAKFAPQVRALLNQYPMATVLGSELGRPDDGTDPTGFFNREFYVGLQRYHDASRQKGTIR